MRTEKVAITIPSDLVAVIDGIRSKRGVSRSKFIRNRNTYHCFAYWTSTLFTCMFV